MTDEIKTPKQKKGTQSAKAEKKVEVAEAPTEKTENKVEEKKVETKTTVPSESVQSPAAKETKKPVVKIEKVATYSNTNRNNLRKRDSFLRFMFSYSFYVCYFRSCTNSFVFLFISSILAPMLCRRAPYKDSEGKSCRDRQAARKESPRCLSLLSKAR